MLNTVDTDVNTNNTAHPGLASSVSKLLRRINRLAPPRNKSKHRGHMGASIGSIPASIALSRRLEYERVNEETRMSTTMRPKEYVMSLIGFMITPKNFIVLSQSCGVLCAAVRCCNISVH